MKPLSFSANATPAMFAGYASRNWSMPMKLTSGVAMAAASVSVVMRNPTVTSTLGLLSRDVAMLAA